MARSTDYQNRTADELIQETDKALYAAKQAGRNCVRIAKTGNGDGDEQGALENSAMAKKQCF